MSEQPIWQGGYLRYLIQLGWVVYPECNIPRIVSDVMARSEADAELALQTAWGDESDVHLCPIVGEVSADDLGGRLGELANSIPKRFLN